MEKNFLLNFFIKNKFYFLVFGFFFISVLSVGFLVQFLFLPHFFPYFYCGDGLICGGDWIKFHREGKEIASQIEKEGLSKKIIEMRKEKKFDRLSLVVGFFYFLFGVHKPWILLPFNAFLHAFSGVLLIIILQKFGFSKKVSFLSSLFFVFFPSSFYWTSQIHNEGIYIFGFYLFFLGVFFLFQKKFKKIFFSFFLLVSGAFLVWTMRPHFILPIKCILFFLTFCFFCRFLINAIKKEKKELKIYFLKILVLILSILILPSFSLPTFPEKPKITSKKIGVERIKLKKDFSKRKKSSFEERFFWKKEKIIPQFLDEKLKIIAKYRFNFLYKWHKDANGNIDKNVIFRSGFDFLKYLPRGLIVGYFSPFPRDWFKKGDDLLSTFQRMVVPFEMIIVWFGLVFFIFSIPKYFKNNYFWFILLSSSILIYLHLIIEPNLGPLYRKRYGFLMLIVALGYANFFSFLKRKIKNLNVKKIKN